MEITDILSTLRSKNIHLSVEQGRLKVNAPAGALTTDLQAALIAHKPELIELLQASPRNDQSAAPRIEPTGRTRNVPLSFSQQRLWFLDQIDQGSPAYVILKTYAIEGSLNVGILEKCVHEIIRRHQALRTIFTRDADNQPVQVVLPPDDGKIPVIDLQEIPAGDREKQALDQIRNQTKLSMDLTKGPLFQVTLYRLEIERHWLMVRMHHIISDGWSIGIFQSELQTLYQAYCSGESSPLPELDVQYVDYAAWQRRWYTPEILFSKIEYWKQSLRKPTPVLELPADHPRPAVSTYHGAFHKAVLPGSLLEQIQHLCQNQGVTPFMLLLAAYKTLLFRYSGQTDLIVGTPVANRGQVEVENCIGFFVNTVALRSDLSGNPTFLDLLQRVRETSLQGFANQDVPFEMVVESLQPERDTCHSPIFQVMFILQNTPSYENTTAGLTFRSITIDPGTSKFDLTLEIWGEDGNLAIGFEYNTDLFAAGRIERMAGHFQTLLQAICANPATPIDQLPLLPPTERHTLLSSWNATDQPYPRSLTLAALFEAQVDRSPSSIALQTGFAGDPPEQLTFSLLDQRANRLAHFLQLQGVGPETLVGLCLPRSADLLVALLAVLKAGGAYLPLDPAFPPERLAFMLQDAAVPLLLTHSSLLPHLPPSPAARILCLDHLALPDTAQRLPPCAAPHHLAYLLYTSGSTGRPKGVAVTQQNLVNFLCSLLRQPGLSPADTLLAVTTLSFDIAGLELYLPLLSGARLALVSTAVAADGSRLKLALEQSQATHLQATPATWRLLLAAGWSGSSGFTALCGGEALPSDLAASLLARVGALWNLYGPTETTIWSTLARVTQAEEPIPIGRPIANTQVYLLDRLGQPVPIGVPGELYIGGDGVARGYLHQPELSAQKFLPNPFRSQPAVRLYRTGDLARYREDGVLEFLGRIDQQIKLRGFRIELGEIEAVLSQHPAVAQAVVRLWEDCPGEQRLVAYLTLAQGQEPPSTSQLRAFLQAQLPEYMLPAAFLFLDRLPLTPNGKIDRKALPKPGETVNCSTNPVQAGDAVEAKLAQIWKKLLHVDRVGIQDDFFTLGGHSMLAVQMFVQIQKTFGVNLPMTSLFHKATIEYLANLIRTQSGTVAWSSLVEIQPYGDRPPFFIVHGLPGDVFWYGLLVPKMRPDQPIWGLQSQGLDGVKAPITSIEEMARLYIQEMKSIQPDGPYYLCGYSFGGTVAYEMACQLEEQGEKIGIVAVVDHATPKSGYYQAKFSPGFVISLLKNLPERIGDILMLEPSQFIARLRRRIHIARKLLLGTLKNTPEIQLEAGDLLFNASSMPAHIQRIIEVNFKAINAYSPRKYNGTVTLLRARGGDLLVSHETDMGWGKFAKIVDIHIIPGSHQGLFRPHRIHRLGNELQGCLDQCQAASK